MEKWRNKGPFVEMGIKKEAQKNLCFRGLFRFCGIAVSVEYISNATDSFRAVSKEIAVLAAIFVPEVGKILFSVSDKYIILLSAIPAVFGALVAALNKAVYFKINS